MTTTATTTAEWVVRLSGTPLSLEEDAALQAWLAADTARAAELEAAAGIWATATSLRHSDIAKFYLERDLRAAQPRRWIRTFWPVAGASLAAAAVAAVFFVSTPRHTSDAPHLGSGALAQTRTGEIASYSLPDNSRVTMAGNSAVHVSFSKQKREAFLEHGEAFFEVEHDTSRPFVVRSGLHQITVTGTKFNVNSLPADEAVEVAIVEGSVLVATGQDSAPTRLSPGEVLFFPAVGKPVRRSLMAEEAAAWRSHQLYFEDAAVRDVLTEVNRYTSKPIIGNDAELGGLRITGKFATGDTTSVIVTLRELFHLNVEELPDRWQVRRGSQATQKQ